MRKLSLATCFLLAVTSMYGQQTGNITDKRLASLDGEFEKILKTWQSPGFAVAVVEKNRIIYAKGFGFRDVEKKLPVTVNTLFPIGSCTKAFTSLLMGILQKDGKLDIDKPAHQYLDALNFFSTDLTNNITLRDMMSHRTGLPRHDFSWYFFNTENRDSLLGRIRYQEPTYPLRRQWQYNNFMFVAQGAIAEKITGKSWEENIREHILQPLLMNQSNFTINDLQKNNDAAIGYGLKDDSIIRSMPYYHINAAGPAGSINSNVLEMSNWMMAWINGGKFHGKEILPADFMQEAISSQAVISAGLPTKEKPDLHFANYGFGWFLSSYKGHYRVEHGGNIDGFSANVSFFPTDSVGIVVLVNQNGSSIPSVVRNMIADKLLKLPYFNWNVDLREKYVKSLKQQEEAKKTGASAQKKGTRPSHELKDYAGLYTNAGYGTFDVIVRNDSVFAIGINKIIFLKHYHYDVFSAYLMEDGKFDTSEESDVRLQFNTGISGDIESLNVAGFESPQIELKFKRTEKEKPLSQEKLEEYTGSFEIMGATVKYYIKDNSLRMFVQGQPEYELIPTGEDKFSVKDLSGYSVQFLRDDKKQVIAVNLIQPNGTFKATKKN